MLDFNDKTQFFFNNSEKIQADINNKMVFIKGNKWLLGGKNGEYGDNAVVVRNENTLSIFSPPSPTTNPFSNFAKKVIDLIPGHKYKLTVWSDKDTYVGLYNANGSVNFASNFSIPMAYRLDGLILPENAIQTDYTFDYTGESVTQLYIAIYCPEPTIITYPFLYDIGVIETGGTTAIDTNLIRSELFEDIARIGMNLKAGTYTNLVIHGITPDSTYTLADGPTGASAGQQSQYIPFSGVIEGNDYYMIPQATISKGCLSILLVENISQDNTSIRIDVSPSSNSDSFTGYGNNIRTGAAGQLGWSNALSNYNIYITFDSYAE